MISANREVLGYVVVGKDSGLLLSNKKRDRKTSDMDVIVFKHHLFWHDSESFYGLSYEIRSLTFKDHNKTVQLEGIWIPLPELFTLLSQVGNWKKDSRVRVDETLLSFHQELQGIHTALLEKAFIPGQKGNWELDMGHNLMNMERLPPILHEKPHFFELCGSKEEGKQLLIDYFSRFLQFAVIKTSNKWTQPYFQALQIQKDRQYQHWIKALQTPANQFHLSEHLYPYALMSWNGKTEKPFQFQLIIQEGQGKDGLWTLKLYVKEWNTGNMYSIEGIYKGQHPFLMNPIPFIKEQWERVNKLFPFTMMEIETGECKLTLEETTHFLFHQVHYIENLGVPVLIPEQIREVYGKPKISGTIHPAEQEDYSGYRTSKISWSFLVNGMVVDDIQFKEWVEGRQEMVYIHNHWVRWDLALAEKLYKEYETSNRESEFYNNWRKAFLWENIPLKEELEMGSPEATEGEIQWSLSEEWNNFKERETTPLPSRWRQLLRPYQLEGVQWLLKMKDHGLGACLADDMGLGKTIQTIAYMDVTIAQTNQKPFLIICPTSLVTNWVEELNKFAPSLSYYVHEGKPSERIKQLKEEYTLSKIIICSYPLAVRDMEVIRGFDWQGLLLDEAQRIKNAQTKIRKAIGKINTYHVVALTGTPVENDPIELWSIIDLLNPGYLKDQAWFQSKFLHGGTDEGDQLEQLKTLVSPFLLRRKKEQFVKELGLPEKRIIQHTVPLSDEQKILYEAVVNDLLIDYAELSLVEKRSRVFKAITKLKQICNHPAHYLKEPSIHRMMDRSGKWDLCLELLEKNWREGKRTLIFTQYRYLGNMLQQFILQEWGIEIPFFHGQLKIEKRKELIDKFQKEKKDPFLLISLRAGGVGLNLTAATEVIHFDRWWNPAVENQATDRVYRIGQKEAVTIHTFTAKGTIEEKMNQLIGEKLTMQDALLNGSASPIWKLDDEEMLALFSLRG